MMFILVPGWGGQQDEFAERLRALDGREAAYHPRGRVAHVYAALDAELVQDAQQVIRVRVQRRVSPETEVVGVGGAGAHEVVQHHLVIFQQSGQHVLPHRLVGSEAVAQEHHLDAAAHDGHIVGVQQTQACHQH